MPFSSLLGLIPGVSTVELVVGGLAIAAVLGGIIYIKMLRAEVDAATQRETVYKASISSLNQTMDAMKLDVVKIQKVNQVLAANAAKNRDQKDALDIKLDKIDNIDVKKAKLLEDAINNASRERSRCAALATGATPMKKEVNRTCPQFLKN